MGGEGKGQGMERGGTGKGKEERRGREGGGEKRGREGKGRKGLKPPKSKFSAYVAAYMVYRTASFSMTLNDPCPRFQGHAILNSLTLNISETVRDTDIVSMKYK